MAIIVQVKSNGNTPSVHKIELTEDEARELSYPSFGFIEVGDKFYLARNGKIIKLISRDTAEMVFDLLALE